MAVINQYVDDLMAEYGRTGIDAQRKFEQSAAEVVLGLLLQNSSRFRRLEKSTTLTFVSGDDAERLPADFRSIKKPLLETKSDGTLIATVEIVSDAEFLKRKQDSTYGGLIYAYIETRQTPTPGEYLVLNADPTETRYFKFSYYRRPTRDDADIIEDEGLVSDGIRAKRADLVGVDVALQASRDFKRGKRSVIEHPGQRATGMSLKPNRSQQRLNKRMHGYGRGR